MKSNIYGFQNIFTNIITLLLTGAMCVKKSDTVPFKLGNRNTRQVWFEYKMPPTGSRA